MDPPHVARLTARLVRHFRTTYPIPQISREWLEQTIDSIVEETEMPFFDYAHLSHQVNEKILNSRLEDITVPGTGLQPPVNPRFAYGFVHGPILLEMTHVTEIGITAFHLEAVRQERELVRHRAGPAVPALPRFPRRCLKILFTDGFMELEAIELEPLPNFALGETPMGRKVFVSNFPIIAGVAYLHPRNVAIVGGSNPDREAEHSTRLVRELRIRVREELADRATLDHVWRQIRVFLSILFIPILWILQRMALLF
ncbi:hypothetical protein NMY22_g19956 [Coprinellus aureogranulatus]|nr:hypothetical protein NMY22_g19956 [Coprinellus aureogranulatus]